MNSPAVAHELAITAAEEIGLIIFSRVSLQTSFVAYFTYHRLHWGRTNVYPPAWEPALDLARQLQIGLLRSDAILPQHAPKVVAQFLIDLDGS
jgi:hypothetical protein